MRVVKKYFPFYILDALIVLLPIAFIIGPSAINIVSFIFLILFIFLSIKNKNWHWVSENYIKIFFLLWFYFIIKSILATDASNALRASFAFIRFLFMALIIGYYGFRVLDFNKVMKIWLLIIIFFCFDICLQFFLGKNILGYESISERNSGLFGKELVAGSFLAQIIAPVLSYILYLIFFTNISSIYKLLLFTSFTLILFASLITGERMNFVFLFFLSSLSFIIIFIYKKKIKNILLIIFLFLTIFISTFNFSSMIQNRYKEFNSITSNFYDSSWGKLYNSAYRLWLKKPLIGYGLKNYRVNCDIELIDINPSSGHQLCSTHPHNFYLEILSESGLIGLIFFLLLFYFYFKKLFYKIKFKLNNQSILTIYICVFSIFLILWPIKTSGSFYTSWNGMYLWILMGIALNRKEFYKKFIK